MSDDLAEEQQRLRSLERLAEVIGCSPRDFCRDGSDLGRMAELLRHWQAIKSDDDRKQLLDLARQLAAR